jgi:hypothetical protein
MIPKLIARPGTIEKARKTAMRATPPEARFDGTSAKQWERHQHTIIDKLEARLREARERSE